MDSHEVAKARAALALHDAAPKCERASPSGMWECRRYAGHPGMCCAMEDDLSPLYLRAVLSALDTERAQHRDEIARLVERGRTQAISGAAMASRLAAEDPDAQRILVESVKAIRDPRAALARVFGAMSAPLDCGHPLDCLDDKTGVCGWCAVLPSTEHPSDCQKCSEDADPCKRHAEDWRYWKARALDAEAEAKDGEK